MPSSKLPTAGSTRKLKDDFGLVILRWESFRILFNLMLIIACLGFTTLFDPANFKDHEFWCYLIAGALLANLLFMTGPAVDGYLTWYGVWTAPISLLLFVAGTGWVGYLALDWISRY